MSLIWGTNRWYYIRSGSLWLASIKHILKNQNFICKRFSNHDPVTRFVVHGKSLSYWEEIEFYCHFSGYVVNTDIILNSLPQLRSATKGLCICIFRLETIVRVWSQFHNSYDTCGKQVDRVGSEFGLRTIMQKKCLHQHI